MAQKEINLCSPNQLKICWHDDPQTLSVLNRHPEAFSLRSGECFPYYLSDRIEEFCKQWAASSGSGKGHALKCVSAYLDSGKSAYNLLLTNSFGAQRDIIISQMLVNYYRTLAFLVQVLTDYADIPQAFSRPAEISIKLCRQLGGLHEYGPHLHGVNPARLNATYSGTSSSKTNPFPGRPIPYSTLLDLKNDRVSVSQIANLLGVSVSSIQSANERSLKQFGDELIRRGYDYQEALGIFKE